MLRPGWFNSRLMLMSLLACLVALVSYQVIPGSGGFSVGQQVDHLSDSTSGSIDRSRRDAIYQLLQGLCVDS